MTDDTTASEPTREVLVALSNAVAGREEEFRSWYWDTHIPEVLTVPGVVSAECFVVSGDQDPDIPFRYLTVYQVDGPATEVRGRFFTAGLGFSDSMDLSAMVLAPFVSSGRPTTR